MKKSWVVAGAVLFLGGLFAVPAARAQRAPVTKEQLDAFGASFKQAQTFYNKLTPTQQNMLSGSALNLFHVMHNWPQVEREALRAQDLIQRRGGQTPHIIPTLPPISPGLRFKLPAFNQPSPIGAPVGTTPAPVNVTDTTKNFIYSASGGFTQNETSTAWCGTQVVVGFNDSGSVFESGFATGFSALSFNGYATSSNQGTTDYTDQGFLPSAGPGLSFPFLSGDPVVACTSATNFFYSSILSANGLAAISVSHSTNGGVTWGSPIIAAAVSAFSGFLDKPWMAVNPANPMQIAVSYTNFQMFFGSCGSGTITFSIDVVMSTDGGTSWSFPTTVFKTCGGTGSTNDPFVQGSQVAFSPNGTLDVAFEFFPEGFAGGRQILFATPFAPIPGFNLNNQGIVPVTTAIDNITGTGDGFQLAGGFRNFIDFQGIAVDSSGTATNGNIYIVWQDTDPTDSERSFNGIEYEYSDIFISVSTNGGASWSPPVKVNTNTETSTSQFDSYLPSVAVDQTSGSVGVCWYDRRADVNNYLFQRFCGKSTNAGTSFTNFAQTNASFQPIHATDNLLNNAYMGDYDTLSTDVLKTTSGFIGAFQVVFPAGTFGANLVPNPIVRARNFD